MEFVADWILLPSEAALLANKTGPTRLDFAILLKFFQYAARFPLSMQEEVPATAVAQKKAVTLVTAITGRAGIWGSSRRPEELLSATTEGGETAEPEHKFREKVETRLADEARRQGIFIDAPLERLINERAALTPPAQCNPELPVWHLGGVGASGLSPKNY